MPLGLIQGARDHQLGGAGQGTWSSGLCSEPHTLTVDYKGFSIHGALCQEDPDVVEPAMHDSEMKS